MTTPSGISSLDLTNLLGPWKRVSKKFSGTSFAFSATVPAVANATSAYLDVSMADTPLATAPQNTPVVVMCTSDLHAAGANGGGLMNARMSAVGTLRLLFQGNLAGGSAAFSVSVP